METLTGRNWHPSDRVIDNHVAQLRKKLESDGNEWIKTVRGVGYLFSGKVNVKPETETFCSIFLLASFANGELPIKHEVTKRNIDIRKALENSEFCPVRLALHI